MKKHGFAYSLAVVALLLLLPSVLAGATPNHQTLVVSWKTI